MADISSHPVDALQEALDGRLSAPALTELNQHLETCETCRFEFAALRWTKGQTAGLRSPVDAGPAQDSAQLRDILDRADASDDRRTGSPAQQHSRSALPPPTIGAVLRQNRTALGAGALAAAILLAVVLLPWTARDTFTDRVAADYRAYRTGDLNLRIETRDIEEIEHYFRRGDLPFLTRVPDLRTMGYVVQGALVHQVSNRPSALVAYEGTDGSPLLCQMYPGRVSELSAPSNRTTQQGVDFLIYHHEEITLVFWQDGDLVCVVAGTGDPQRILQLAIAEAGRAQGARHHQHAAPPGRR